MPLVKIEIIEGKPREYKEAVLDGVHQALVRAREFRIVTVFSDCMNCPYPILNFRQIGVKK